MKRHQHTVARWSEREIRSLLDSVPHAIVVVNGSGTIVMGAAERLMHFAAIVEASNDAIVSRTAEGIITSWNPAAERLYGYTAAEALGHPLSLITPPELAGELPRVIEHLKRRQRMAPFETVRVRKDGTRIDVSVSVAAIWNASGEVVGTTFSSRDITERKRTREELERRSRELESLSRQLIDVQESERRNLAREMHDEVGQLLTSLSLVASPSEPGEADAKLHQVRALAAQLAARVRDVSANLQSAVLDDLGLLPALSSHCHHFEVQAAIHVSLEQQGLEGRRFRRSVELAAYRIIQEALTNAARHAGVPEVTVRVWTTDQFLNVQIEDAGAGFDSRGTSHDLPRLGLRGMRERARLLGGGLTVESQPGRGTCVTAYLPIEAGAPD